MLSWNESYPRPQLRRDNYLLLNGEWEFALTPGPAPETYPLTIQVPYPLEAPLSGVGQRHRRGDVLWYRRRFSLPACFAGKRVLLHCGGVDQRAAVFVNGQAAGEMDFTRPTLDITPFLQAENTLVFSVWDDCRDLSYPYGKQRENRGGMWYTPVTGLWQTVWLEGVPERYISGIRLLPREGAALLKIQGAAEGTVTLRDGTVIPLRGGEALLRPKDPEYWTPENPKLYDFTIETAEDRVESYFALRQITAETRQGHPRLCLNGQPYFFHGLLDQGYWPQGIYTPESPADYERDIQAAKPLGFNTLRKHIKIEPEQFYYACDRLGMAVFQDMVNNGPVSYLRDTALPNLGWQTRRTDRRMHRNKKSRARFLAWMEETVARLGSHPCVMYWTIFNEGWGQFDSGAVYRRLRALDDTRIIDSTSGWFRCGETDVESRHVYFKPFAPVPSDKPLVLSEYGGYGWKLPDHAYPAAREYGYRNFADGAAFMDALEALYRQEILPAIPQGLCAAIYTQLTDVEEEINGLITYDRAVTKPDPQRMQRLAQEMKEAMNPPEGGK